MIIRASFIFRLRHGSHPILRSCAFSWLSGHGETSQEQLPAVESPSHLCVERCADVRLRRWLRHCAGSRDAINLHACLKRARDHDLAICIYMQGRYIDQDNRTGGTADVD